MSAEENKAIVRQYMKAWDTGDAAVFEEVLASDFVDYMEGQLRTREALLQQATGTDFSTDRQNTIEDMIAEGDKVAVRYTSRFTHVPTGRHVVMTGMFIVRILDGIIVEGWGERDRLSARQQAGLLPTLP